MNFIVTNERKLVDWCKDMNMQKCIVESVNIGKLQNDVVVLKGKVYLKDSYIPVDGVEAIGYSDMKSVPNIISYDEFKRLFLNTVKKQLANIALLSKSSDETILSMFSEMSSFSLGKEYVKCYTHKIRTQEKFLELFQDACVDFGIAYQEEFKKEEKQINLFHVS